MMLRIPDNFLQMNRAEVVAGLKAQASEFCELGRMVESIGMDGANWYKEAEVSELLAFMIESAEANQ